jgi:hypothetical protein
MHSRIGAPTSQMMGTDVLNEIVHTQFFSAAADFENRSRKIVPLLSPRLSSSRLTSSERTSLALLLGCPPQDRTPMSHRWSNRNLPTSSSDTCPIPKDGIWGVPGLEKRIGIRKEHDIGVWVYIAYREDRSYLYLV